MKIRFEVTVSKGTVDERDVVRITGSTASLGQWNVLSSVKLHKSKEQDIWSVEVDVEENCVQYRFMITNDLISEAFRVKSWEAFEEPRKYTFDMPTSQRPAVRTLHVHEEYGVKEAGERSQIEAGWLVSTSELHLQLGTLEASISLIDHPQYTHYLLKVQPFSLHSSKSVECSPIKAKLLDRTAGNSVTFDLGTGTCPYNQQNNLVIFTTESVDFQNTGFSFDVYNMDLTTSSLSPPVPLSPTASKVGRASLLPRQYLGSGSQGTHTLTIFSHTDSLLPIGTLTLSFLLIHPIRDVPSLHSTRHTHHWKNDGMKYIGHRGMGDSHHPLLHPAETENTIASLKMAGNHGVDYVEFDVHLTKNHVPIVYHDFLVNTKLCNIAIKDLTREQLQSLHPDHSSGEGKADTSTVFSLPFDKRLLPTLQDVLQSVPLDLGFIIEVKFPLPERTNDGMITGDYAHFDCNVFADAILRVVDSCALQRRMAVSCFNPDMCTVFRRKQSKYPVLFLASCMNSMYGTPLDTRANELKDAMMHVAAEELSGIVADSYIFMEEHLSKNFKLHPNSRDKDKGPHLIKMVKDRGFVLLTWGDTNNNREAIEMQRKAGVDGVHCDCIDRLLS